MSVIKSQKEKNQKILFVAHGSPTKIYQEDIKKFEEELRKFSIPETEIEICFIEHQEPTFSEKIEELDSSNEIKRVFVEPIFLFKAGHILDDIEPKVRSTKNRWKFHLNKALAEREHFIEMYSCLIRKNIEKSAISERTIFLFVGRGTSNMYAAGDIYKFSRIIWEKLDKKGEMFVSFAEVTKPSPLDILSEIKLEEFESLTVIPIVLFKGYVEKKIEKDIINFLGDNRKEIKQIQFIPPVGHIYREEFVKFLLRPFLFLHMFSEQFRNLSF